MEFRAKLFSWQDTGNHLFVLARGAMDGPGLGDSSAKSARTRKA